MINHLLIRNVVGLAFVLAVAAVCSAGTIDKEKEVQKLVQDLRVKGEALNASQALVKLGPPAVAEICKEISALGPALDNESDVILLISGLITLGHISKNYPSQISIALPCLLRTARKTSNKKARGLILHSIQLYGPSAVPHLLNFLNSTIKNPPPEDSDTKLTQALITYTLMNMAETDPKNVDQIIKQLEKSLDTAPNKAVIIMQLANMSQLSRSVIVVLEKQLKLASDPAYKKQVKQALEVARENAPKQ